MSRRNWSGIMLYRFRTLWVVGRRLWQRQSLSGRKIFHEPFKKYFQFQSGYYCGTDNCQFVYPGSPSTSDCCQKYCDGTDVRNNNFKYFCNTEQNIFAQGSCCSASEPCGLYGGDCDSDDDCIGDLKCGSDNCIPFWPQANSIYDCCVPWIKKYFLSQFCTIFDGWLCAEYLWLYTFIDGAVGGCT